jgi:PKD repeat protein
VDVNLLGTVDDPDGDPMTTTWSRTSGPAPVTFGNAAALETTATFTAAGTYVLRLTADDGYGSVYDEVTIIVSEAGALPEVSVTATDPSASEEGPDTGTFTISRVGDTAGSLDVLFTMGGTATSGDDYSLSHSSPVTIPADQSSVTITLTPVDDSEFVEGNETVVLTISPDTAYAIATASDSVTIAENDNNAPGVEQVRTLTSPWMAQPPGLQPRRAPPSGWMRMMRTPSPSMVTTSSGTTRAATTVTRLRRRRISTRPTPPTDSTASMS